jgi:pre-mRNA-splicing regulator WTAP
MVPSRRKQGGRAGSTDIRPAGETCACLCGRFYSHRCLVQVQLRESQAAADRLRSAFKEVATCCGYANTTRDVEIPTVVEGVQSLRNSEKALQVRNAAFSVTCACSLKARTLQVEVKQLRQKEAGLHIQLAEKNFESTELRRELNSAWQASDPSIIQLKQLLLDPAINREFQRLKSELGETQKELKHVQEDLQAVNFTQESKTGRALMAKCKSLQEENDEMGRELAEGKVHQLDAQLSIAREYADELKKNYLELSDHCQTLDEEAEHMQQQLFALRNQVHVLELQAKQQTYDRRQQEDARPPFVRKPMGRGGMKRQFPDRDGPMRMMMAGKQRKK